MFAARPDRRSRPALGSSGGAVADAPLPDPVDKPLAWTADVTETGYGIAHSAFVAPLLWCAVVAAAARRGAETRLAAGAFALAYASHLATDVYDPTRPERGVVIRAVLWPIASPPSADRGGPIDHVLVYLLRYVHQFAADDLTPQALLRVVLAVSVAVLWFTDGAPIVADAWQWLRNRQRA